MTSGSASPLLATRLGCRARPPVRTKEVASLVAEGTLRPQGLGVSTVRGVAGAGGCGWTRQAPLDWGGGRREAGAGAARRGGPALARRKRPELKKDEGCLGPGGAETNANADGADSSERGPINNAAPGAFPSPAPPGPCSGRPRGARPLARCIETGPVPALCSPPVLSRAPQSREGWKGRGWEAANAT